MQAQNDALEDIHIDVSQENIYLSPYGDMAWATNQWVFNARMGPAPEPAAALHLDPAETGRPLDHRTLP